MPKYEPSHLKVMNTKIVYQEFLKQEGLFVKEIARLTKISVPTVMKITNFLLEKKLIEEQECTTIQVGRKPHMLALNRDKYFSISAIYEGDDMHIGIVDLSGHVVDMIQIRCGQRFEASVYQSIDNLLEASQRSVHDLVGIGIGMPCIFKPDSREIIAPLIGIEKPKYFGDFMDALAEKYKAKIIVDNDLNVKAYGEFASGVRGTKEDMIFISLGTGLGAGVIIDGKIRSGDKNLCGEIGYMMFEYSERKPKIGWLEEQINMKALMEKFGISETLGKPQQRAEAIEYMSKYLAMAVNNLTFSFDIRDIVLAGRVVTLLGDEIVEITQQKLNKICFDPVRIRKKSTPFPGLSGGGLLASNLWLEELFIQ